MAGYNVYLLKPEIIPGPPQQLKAWIYMRERPDDMNPGNELDMGVPAREFVLAPGPFNSQNNVMRAGIRGAINAMYGLNIEDRDLLVPPHKAAGLNRFFNSKECRRIKPQ